MSVKNFTDADVVHHGDYTHIYADTSELLDAQPDWMRKGLQETRTGYGKRLNTGRSILFNNKVYRLYATCFSNAASVWFKVKGVTIYVS